MNEKGNGARVGMPVRTAQYLIELYLILVGLAFGFSIDDLLKNPSPSAMIRFSAVAVMLIVWLHAQMGFEVSETYSAGVSWSGRVLEHYLEIASLILLVIMALSQKQEVHFYVALITAHGLDLIVQAIRIKRLRKDPNLSRQREIATSWLRIDLITVLAIGSVAAARRIPSCFPEWAASLLTLVAITGLAIYDYWDNRDFYFGLPRAGSRKSKKQQGHDS